MKETLVIGIDGAVDPRNTGYAYGLIKSNECVVERAGVGPLVEDLVIEAQKANVSKRLVLFAIDAPLGWPTALGPALTAHAAGGELGGQPDELFRRTTDRFIQERIDHRPLDVGADKIARTAKAMLDLLAAIRRNLQEEIPLAWSPGQVQHNSCIEVYPAATLVAYGLDARAYKGSDGARVRARLVQHLAAHGNLSAVEAAMVTNDDVFDAVVCVLAAADFLRGEVLEPPKSDRLDKEGWIWVAKPREGQSGEGGGRDAARENTSWRANRNEKVAEAGFRDGRGASLKVGTINRNDQECRGTRGFPGTDHCQSAYRMKCRKCNYEYGANGSDVFQRKCPRCQGGRPSIPF